MTINTLRRRLAPVVAAAVVAGLAGCGDDDTPSPEDTQQRLEGEASEAVEGAKERLQQEIDEAQEEGGQAEGKAKELLEDLLRQTQEGE